MSKKLYYLSLLMVIGSLLFSACGSLISQVENAVQEEYGPALTSQERQTRTFEALWKHLEENYVYYNSANVDWKTLHEKYVARIEAGLTSEQFEELMKGLETDLPNGALIYESRSDRITNDTKDTAAYEGIGAIIGFHEDDVPHVVILDVIAGSPAEKAGLKPHDSIYAIDGNPVLLEEGLTVVNRIRGPAGSQVTLQVKTPGKDERAIEVTRGKLISSGKITAYTLEGTGYGYILFPPVNYNNLLPDILNTLKGFSADENFAGLILDLRVANSSGGFPLEELLTLFYNGEIGEFYNVTNETQPVSVEGQNQFDSQKIPLVILVGKNTSGFAEILASSLQAGKRAVLVGEATSGGVGTTSMFYLPDGSRVYIETTSFRLPNGEEIGSNGIQPNVLVDAGWDDVLPGADPVLDQAIQSLDEQQ